MSRLALQKTLTPARGLLWAFLYTTDASSGDDFPSANSWRRSDRKIGEVCLGFAFCVFLGGLPCFNTDPANTLEVLRSMFNGRILGPGSCSQESAKPPRSLSPPRRSVSRKQTSRTENSESFRPHGFHTFSKMLEEASLKTRGGLQWTPPIRTPGHREPSEHRCSGSSATTSRVKLH